MSVLLADPHLDMDQPPARWLTATEKRVLLAIYAANIAGKMPLAPTIAAELGLSVESVRAALTVLGGHDLVRGTRPL